MDWMDSIFWVGIITYLVADITYYRKEGPCGCGLVRIPFLWPWHGTTKYHIFRIALNVAMGCISALALGDWAIGLIWVVWVIKEGVAVWLHERDRRKKIARAIGRVIVNAYGRLRVAPAPA